MSSFSVHYELFLEQRRELVERDDVAIWETDEPLQHYACECGVNNIQCMASVPPEIII